MPCFCCCPRRSSRSSVASWSCQKSSRLRVIAARIDPFSLLISLYNVSNLETVCYKRCSKSLLKNAKIPRRVDVRRLKIDCKTVRIFAYSSRASSQTKGLEWCWKQRARLGRDAKNTVFFLSPHTLRARKTLTPRFTDFFTDFEKKTDCFAVYLKTSLLKTWGGLLLFSFPPKKENWSAPGGIPTKFHAWRLRPKIVQPLTLLYTIFDKKGTPFFVYLLFFNCCKCKVFKIW